MQAKDDEIAELARTVAGLQSALDERGSAADAHCGRSRAHPRRRRRSAAARRRHGRRAARRRRVGALPLPGRTPSARCRATRRNFLSSLS